MAKFYTKYHSAVTGEIHDEDKMMYGIESRKCYVCDNGTMWVSLECMTSVCSEECLFEMKKAFLEDSGGKK